jgi:hypothetical protein
MSTQLQTAPHLRGHLLNIRENGAVSLIESATPAAVDVIEAIKRDLVLSRIDTENVSLPEIVFKILMKGSPVERVALGNVLTPEACFIFPGAYHTIEKGVIGIEAAIRDIIKPMFSLLCDHFGVSFSGNQDTVALTMLNQYGGLSFADFSICFSRVMAGSYRKETHHLMSRGINYEFMQYWLDQYSQDREQARISIHEATKPDNVAAKASNFEVPDFIQDFKREQDIKRSLERQADEVFGVWQKSLYETAVLTQGIKKTRQDEKVIENGAVKYAQDGTAVIKTVTVETLCDDSEAERFDQFPVQVFRPGGAGRVLRRCIYGFVAFGNSDETIEIYEALKQSILEKYADEGEKAEHYFEAEQKMLINEVAAFLKKCDSQMFIRQVFRQIYPDVTEQQISASTAQTVDKYKVQYYEYLKNCIDKNIPRFTFPEWLISETLPFYLKQGFSNPITKILNHA